MIPHDKEEWFKNAPWSGPQHRPDFWQYWEEVNSGAREEDHFIRFGDGVHELAHFITCEDQHILDPHWGCQPITNPHAASNHDIDIEAEFFCAYVEDWIWCWTDKNLGLDKPPSFEAMKSLAPGEYKTKTGKYKWNYEQVSRTYMRIRARFPTIESIWQELQRKQALLRQALA